MANGELAPVAYRAFLSYSHKDAAAAARLHRQLETYKLPKHLIGSKTASGIEAPGRLTPIFRDREELSAGSDLSAQVQAALQASEALIILCSPNASASQWVGKEIETFRAIHPDRPVLAALLHGEPEDAFPKPLTAGGAEPIAADLRKGKDGSRLGRLKLVSGVTGVPLDALVQRDAQRQLRRVTAITAGALAAVLVMALLLVVALRAQSEAERQQAEAEGLVEYMLTDLRDRLKGVGRLDVMTAVNERAMKYYGGQASLDGLEPESLNRRARILHAMGEDDLKRAHIKLALEKFNEARRVTTAAFNSSSDNTDSVFAHSQSLYWVGYAHHQASNWDEAHQNFQGYLSLARILAEQNPQNPSYLAEVGYAYSSLGSLSLEGRKDPKKALEHFTAALTTASVAKKMDPDAIVRQTDIASAQAWISDCHFALANYEAAREARLIERSIYQNLSDRFPQNLSYLQIAAVADRSLALIAMKQSKAKEAKQRAEMAHRSFQFLSARDPANADVEFQKLLSEIDIASAEEMSGNLRAAERIRAGIQARSEKLKRRFNPFQRNMINRFLKNSQNL